MSSRVFAGVGLLCRVEVMSLAPHQKAAVDLASFRTKIAALRGKGEQWQPHPELEGVLRSLTAAEKALQGAMNGLARLPLAYAPHASKVQTTDILEGATVSIRIAKRREYETLCPADQMHALKVVAVGTGVATLELPSGIRIAVRRGDISTSTP